MEPVRERERTYHCCCRMAVYNLDGNVIGHDYCPGRVDGPDEPICQTCIDAEHPQQEAFDPAIPSVLTQERSNT